MVLKFSKGWKGQKERLVNVRDTLNAAFNPFSKDRVQANTGSTTVNRALEAVANHPYVTAGVAAAAVTAAPAAITAVRNVGSVIRGAATGATVRTLEVSAATQAARSTATRYALIAAGAGAAGLILGNRGGNATTGDQTTNPSQSANADQANTNNPSAPSVTDNRNYSRNYFRDSPGASLNQTPTGPTIDQGFDPSIGIGQDQVTTPTQSAEGGSTDNSALWLILLGVGALTLAGNR